ncbi:MAG: Flp pilus assembly protein CpaB [Deltaproteobacteria bacterium]|nr:Flp pilus assembly protein CpaB [Deltaproteobacteria bacterium]
MNRGLRTVLVLVVALTMAGLASYAVYRGIQNIPVREVEVAQAFTVVATKSLPVGVMISRDDAKVVPWPAANPIAAGFSQVDQVVGRGLIAPVAENEPITEPKLAPREAGAGLAPSIPPGMRAISVRVNDVIGVAGFVVPGSRVDVLVTVRQQDDMMNRVVVPNVLVLAAGTRYDSAQAKDGKPIPTAVVTFALTPQDGERIALASTEGKITLALRNPLDAQPIETPGIRLSRLLGSTPAPPVETKVRGIKMMVAASPPPPPPPPPVYKVEMIKAAKRTEEVVK